jgi:hypothetical protein
MKEKAIDLTRATHTKMDAVIDRHSGNIFAENIYAAKGRRHFSID